MSLDLSLAWGEVVGVNTQDCALEGFGNGIINDAKSDSQAAGPDPIII